MIACTLHEIAPSLKHGVTLDELTVCLFPAMFAVIAAIGLMTTLVVVEPAIQKAFAERNAYSLCITSSLL
jgi:hypothetical protein